MFVKKKYLTPFPFCCMIAKVIEVDKILEQTLLFDFYGELLTKHQKEIYERFVSEDLSLGEIAEEAGISRQGVHDLIRRCNQALRGYEEKLHLVSKFERTRQMVEEIQQRLRSFWETEDKRLITEIEQISADIMDL